MYACSTVIVLFCVINYVGLKASFINKTRYNNARTIVVIFKNEMSTQKIVFVNIRF